MTGVIEAEASGSSDVASAINPATDEGKSASREPRKMISKKTIAIIAVSLVAAGGWYAFVSTSSNLNHSLSAANEHVQNLEAENGTLRGDFNRMRESRDSYKKTADDAAAMSTELAGREAAVKAREDAVTATENRIKATTLIDGMYYTVGVSMEAGTYQANSTDSSCYWEITKSGTNYSDIVDNDLGAMGVITVSVSKGQDLQTHRCGDWTKIG